MGKVRHLLSKASFTHDVSQTGHGTLEHKCMPDHQPSDSYVASATHMHETFGGCTLVTL